MLEELKEADEEQLLVLEEEFRELTLKEAEIVAQLTEVRTAKQRVRRLVAEKRNRYAPIFTLPDELLACIVQAGQESPDADADRPLIEVLASHISQRFRWATVSTPSLWRHIELRWGVKSDAARFAAYLERARACTLSIVCKYSSYAGTEECDYGEVHDELSTVAEHMPRVRRLVLECGGLGMSVEDAVAHFSELRAPCLEYVEVLGLVSEMDDPEDANYASLFTRGAPCLTTLKLENVFPVYWGPWVPSLSSLDLRQMHNPAILYVLPKFLASCPRLIDLTLDSSTYLASEPELNNFDISLPSLRSLKVLRLNSGRLKGLLLGVLPRIHAPALENLQYSGVYGAQVSAFLRLLPPSKFPTLRSLTFANSSAPGKPNPLVPERVMPGTLRRHFPSLASLTFANVCHVTQLLGDLLANPKEDGPPALRILTLRYKDVDDFGIASWPRLNPWPPDHTRDPLHTLRTLVAIYRETRPLRVRLPRSRFFTESDWDKNDADFEIFDAQPLLRALGHDTDDELEGPELVLAE